MTSLFFYLPYAHFPVFFHLKCFKSTVKDHRKLRNLYNLNF